MAFTHALSTNRYGEGDLIVSTSASNGTHVTLASAMADAVSGQTIFLRDSVTENVTITPGVNITAWSGGTLNVPSITGTLTMTAAGTSTISGLRLVTNAAAIIAVTGSAASILNVNNCYLSMGSNAITYSSSSSSSALNLNNCYGDITAGSTLMFAHSSAGSMVMRYCNIQNTGASTTANTLSAGTLNLFQTLLSNPLTTSGTTATFANNYSFINCNTLNVTALTHGCTAAGGAASNFGNYASGSASAISISASCSMRSYNDNIGSNTTNAVTGAGTITFSSMSFYGTGVAVNTTTQTGGVATGIIRASSPSAGFIGEQIRSQVAINAVAPTNNTPVNITSINVTAGVWDLCGMISFSGPTTATYFETSISTTTGTRGSPLGDAACGIGGTVGLAATAAMNPAVSGFRVATTAASTTYYLVAFTLFTAGSCLAGGRISATRVG